MYCTYVSTLLITPHGRKNFNGSLLYIFHDFLSKISGPTYQESNTDHILPKDEEKKKTKNKKEDKKKKNDTAMERTIQIVFNQKKKILDLGL